MHGYDFDHHTLDQTIGHGLLHHLAKESTLASLVNGNEMSSLPLLKCLYGTVTLFQHLNNGGQDILYLDDHQCMIMQNLVGHTTYCGNAYGKDERERNE